MIEQAVLLVGGKATRLGNLALDRPKALQLVNGRPFLGYQLELLARQGIRRVLLCTGYLAKQFAEIGDGSQHGVVLTAVADRAPAIGTGGALRDAEPLLDDVFAVEYGDTYLRAPLQAIGEAFARSDAAGLMTVLENEDRFEPSNVWLENGTIRAYGKSERRPEMRHIEYGLSVLRRATLRDLPESGPADVGYLFKSLIRRNALMAYEVFDRFYEIGTPATLRETEAFLKDHHHESTGTRPNENAR